MIKKYTYVNSSGQSISFGPGERYAIIRITGVTGAKADLSRTPSPDGDGSTINNIRIEERNVTILAEAMSKGDIPYVLTVFDPKKGGTLYGDSTFIECNCEDIDPMEENLGTAFFLSLIAPYPYFSSVEERVKKLVLWEKKWTFPFSLPRERTFVFGTRSESGRADVFNDGQVGCPATISIQFNGTVKNPKLAVLETGQYLMLNRTFNSGDLAEIDTYQHREDVRINGETDFDSLDKGSDFFWLPQGASTVEYSADLGALSMEVTISYRTYYLGVA